MAENTPKTGRNAKGQITKGNTANPKGRPKGTDKTKLTRMTAQKRAILLVEKLLDRADAKVEAELQQPKALWAFLVAEPAGDVRHLGVEGPRPRDVDTPEDYEALLAEGWRA